MKKFTRKNIDKVRKPLVITAICTGAVAAIAGFIGLARRKRVRG